MLQCRAGPSKRSKKEQDQEFAQDKAGSKAAGKDGGIVLTGEIVCWQRRGGYSCGHALVECSCNMCQDVEQ